MAPMEHLPNLIGSLRDCCAKLPDRRTGSNSRYAMADIALSAFSIFFMQSPSFLAHQRALEDRRGHSNCRTLFAMDMIASDNHIRSMLDEVAPEHLFSQFSHIVSYLDEHGGLDGFRRLDGRLLVALDGTEYFTSRKLSCRNLFPPRARQRQGVLPHHGVGGHSGAGRQSVHSAPAGIRDPPGRPREAGL